MSPPSGAAHHGRRHPDLDFGCDNGLILAGARVYYAMAQDGLFFRARRPAPTAIPHAGASLLVQCVWTCVLCISGTYGQLLDYIIFAALLFYILTIAGLFVLRVQTPDAPRPYRAWATRCCRRCTF